MNRWDYYTLKLHIFVNVYRMHILFAVLAWLSSSIALDSYATSDTLLFIFASIVFIGCVGWFLLSWKIARKVKK
jgi:hypothetical protein